MCHSIIRLYFVTDVFACLLIQHRYHQAKLTIVDRAAKVAAVVESLERDLELLCLTGVEDKLQQDVRPTLELLKNAGIKVGQSVGTEMTYENYQTHGNIDLLSCINDGQSQHMLHIT